MGKGGGAIAYKLLDLKVDEVSLVDRPANRRRFLLFKREGGDSMDFAEELREEEKLAELLKAKDSDLAQAIEVLDGAGLEGDAKKAWAKIRAALKKLLEYGYPDYGYAEPKKSAGRRLLDWLFGRGAEAVEKGFKQLNPARVGVLRQVYEALGTLLKEIEEPEQVTAQEPPVEERLRALLTEALQPINAKLEELPKLAERVEALEAAKGVKKSLDGQDATEGSKGKSLWSGIL